MFRDLFIFAALFAVIFASPTPYRGGRIVGGSAAAISNFPFAAVVGGNPGGWWCSGVIINNRWVLSAAHCTVDVPQNGIRVRVGTATMNSGGVIHVSSRVINHPQYDDWSLINDISVVQTATVISFNANVRAANLASAHTGGGVNSIVIGWGSLSVTGSMSNQLMQLPTTTLTNADCRARHRPGDREYIFDSKICSFTRNGQGICSGDSGGPLLVGDTVIGISIWAVGCGSGFPDVYSRVSSHRTWILNSIN